MACSTCGPVVPPLELPCVPVPLVSTPPPDCLSEEVCLEVEDTDCVAYTGAALPYLHILPNMRLTAILARMNQAFSEVGLGRVYLEGNAQLQVLGDGTRANSYRLSPILDPDVANLLRATQTGLSATVDDDQLQALLVRIKNTPVLHAYFCAICTTTGTPDPNQPVCLALGLATALLVAISGEEAQLQTSWTLPTGLSAGSRVHVQTKAKHLSGSVYVDDASGNVLSSDLAVVLGNYLPNLVVLTRLQTYCQYPQGVFTAGPYSNVIESAAVTAVGTVTLQSTLTTVTASFQHLGADVSGYDLVLTATGQPTLTASLNPPTSGTALSYVFSNLAPGTVYSLNVTTKVDTYTKTAFKGTVTTTSVTVGTCATPLNLTTSYLSNSSSLVLDIPVSGNPLPSGGWHVAYRDIRYLTSSTPSLYPERVVNSSTRSIVLTTGIAFGETYSIDVTAVCDTMSSAAFHTEPQAGQNCNAPVSGSITATVVPITLGINTAKLVFNYAPVAGTQRALLRIRYRLQGTSDAYVTVDFAAATPFPQETITSSLLPSGTYEALATIVCPGQAESSALTFTIAPAPAVTNVRYRSFNLSAPELNEPEVCDGTAYNRLYRRVSVQLVNTAGQPTTVATPTEFTFHFQSGVSGQQTTELGVVNIPAGQSDGSAIYASYYQQEAQSLGVGGSCDEVLTTYTGISNVSNASITPY